MKKLFGGILLAIGILTAGAAGLCSALCLIPGFVPGGRYLDTLGIVALVGGIPLAIGIGLIFLGRHLLKPDPEE